MDMFYMHKYAKIKHFFSAIKQNSGNEAEESIEMFRQMGSLEHRQESRDLKFDFISPSIKLFTSHGSIKLLPIQ